jgi:hypothetical protein
MKKNYLKLIVAIVFASNLFAQNIPSYVPKDGLVGWWPFNGNANDESGNGNDGTVSGATLTNDRNGKINSAYNFQGTSNEIIISKSQTLIQSSFSVSSWCTIDNLNPINFDATIIGQMNGGNPNERKWLFGFRKFNSESGISYYMWNTSGILQSNNYTSNWQPNQNQWYNITWVFDSGNSIKTYVNGTLHSNVNVNFSTFSNLANDVLIKIGNASDIDSELPLQWNGKIDDIAIYNRSLTQQEITALYTSTPLCTNPIATITPQGNTTFCQGGFVNLQAYEGANYSYEWFNNSQLIAGAKQSVYQASTNGFYTVKVKDGACNATSNSVPVTVNPNPIAKITPDGPTAFCQGGFVNLQASERANYSYEWFNNSQLIAGATQSVYQASTNGFYTVKVKDGACNATSNSVPVTVNPNPIAKITPDGPIAFCEGGAVNLVASGGTTYKWNSGSLSPSIKVTQTGTYYVNVINSYGCSENKSYDVKVYPNPTVSITPIPQFILQNNSSMKLSATPSGGTFKGEGVTGTSFSPSKIGLGKKTIYYNYTSTQGCSGSAKLQTIVVDSIGTKCTSYDTITVTNTINDTVGILKIKFQLTTGIKANQFTSVSVYPNPTSDVLIIDASDVQALNGYRYKIIDVLGKSFYNELVSATKTEISLKTFGKAGVYILHVVDANNVSIETRQIMLE